MNATFWAGMGIALGALLPLTIGIVLIRYGLRHRNFGEALQTVFLSPQLQPNLLQAIQQYNRQVAVRCGARVPVRRAQPLPPPSPRTTPLPPPSPRTTPPPATVPPPAQ